MMKRAIAILSGGLDSATALAMILAEDKKYIVTGAIWFGYGQRHRVEQFSASLIAANYNLPLRLVEIPQVFKANQLTDLGQKPRTNTPMREITSGVAPTFVPGRNMVMLSLAAAYAAHMESTEIVGGWHWDDSSGYPDCRAEFVESMNRTIQLAMGDNRFNINAPLISMSKDQIVAKAIELEVPVNFTWSCYSPVRGPDARADLRFYGEGVDVRPCGECDTCQLRIKGFKEAGYIDPVNYVAEIDWTGCKSTQQKML